MTTTFEDKVAYVASSFYRRYDDMAEDFDSTNEYPAVLRTIFSRHDMAGAVALALFNGDIEVKTDNAKKWIEESYDVLTSVFGDPSDAETSAEDVVADEKPAKPAKKAAS